MAQYELAINIMNPDYINQLVVALVHQGYAVYYNPEENVVCCRVGDDELTKLTLGNNGIPTNLF